MINNTSRTSAMPPSRVIGGIAAVFNVVACLMLLITVALFAFEVVSRYALGKPTGWVDVAGAYLLSGAVFAAVGYALAQDAHIKIEFFLGRLRGAPRRVVELFGEVVGVAVAGLLFVLSVQSVMQVARRGQQNYAGDVIFAEWIPRLIMPAGLAVLLIVQLLRLAIAARALVVPGGEAASGLDPRSKDLL